MAAAGSITTKTLYTWREKFGGMDVSDAKRLRQLGDGNARLKEVLADQVLDNDALWSVLAKKW